MVQRHRARNLHFDLRLEIDGVLVSWAVPKGPSLDPSVKRLAHRVEDHDLDYLDFEGRIGDGYGAGTVVVWDIGTFDNRTERDGRPVDAAAGLAAGHLKVALAGQKLRGEFALTHTRLGGDDANWLLVKVADDQADRSGNALDDRSVLTGRSNDELGG